MLTLSNVQGLVKPYTLKIRVSVVPCLVPQPQPGDSVINDDRVRKGLQMVLDSVPASGNPWNRRERGGLDYSCPMGPFGIHYFR